MAALQAHFNNVLTGFAFPAPLRVQIIENAPDATVLRDATHAEIDTIIRAVREPGGAVPNPAVAAAVAANQPVANIPPAVRNHGVACGFFLTKVLKQIQFFFFHRHCHLQLPEPPLPAAAAITQVALNLIHPCCESHLAHKEDEIATVAKCDVVKLKETLDAIGEALGNACGDVGVPLACVTRGADLADNAVPADEARAASGGGWTEIVACTRHDGKCWADDNAKVWTMLCKVFFDTPGWTWISSFPFSVLAMGELPTLLSSLIALEEDLLKCH